MLQAISGSRVRNRLPFGRALVTFLADWRMHLPGHGWLDGGCWTLAGALRCWSQDALSLSAIWVPGTRAERITHVLATLRSGPAAVHLDGDGAGDEDDVLAKMRELEMTPTCRVAPFNRDFAFGVPYYGRLVGPLALELAKEFGAFTPRLLQATGTTLPQTASDSTFAY